MRNYQRTEADYAYRILAGKYPTGERKLKSKEYWLEGITTLSRSSSTLEEVTKIFDTLWQSGASLDCFSFKSFMKRLSVKL